MLFWSRNYFLAVKLPIFSVVLKAGISGCGTVGLIFKHLIPNILPQCIVYMSTGVASAIIMLSSFSFLGLGLPEGTAEWGAMMNKARTGLYSHPEMLVYMHSNYRRRL